MKKIGQSRHTVCVIYKEFSGVKFGGVGEKGKKGKENGMKLIS